MPLFLSSSKPMQSSSRGKWLIGAAIYLSCIAGLWILGRNVSAQQAKQAALKVAAKGGKASAQHQLGLVYQIGQGVPQDYAEAKTWYLRAAEKGFAPAMHSLGLLYYAGRGMKSRDLVQAYAWHMAELGRLGRGCEAMSELPRLMTNEETLAAHAQASAILGKIR